LEPVRHHDRRARARHQGARPRGRHRAALRRGDLQEAAARRLGQASADHRDDPLRAGRHALPDAPRRRAEEVARREGPLGRRGRGLPRAREARAEREGLRSRRVLEARRPDRHRRQGHGRAQGGLAVPREPGRLARPRPVPRDARGLDGPHRRGHARDEGGPGRGQGHVPLHSRALRLRPAFGRRARPLGAAGDAPGRRREEAHGRRRVAAVRGPARLAQGARRTGSGGARRDPLHRLDAPDRGPRLPRRRRAARAAVGAQEDALRRGHPPRRRPPARRRQGRLIFLAALLLAAAPALSAPKSSSVPRLPADALALPLAPQETDFSCGAASLLSVLRYWRAFDGAEKDLYGVLGTTPADGTEPPKLVEAARRYGLRARWAENLEPADLRRALARGEAAILDIQAWPDKPPKSWRDDWDDGHY